MTEKTQRNLPTDRQDLVFEAQLYLRGKKSFENDKILEMANLLEQGDRISHARRVRLRLFEANPGHLKNVRKLAVMTYKDDDLPSEVKFEKAAKYIYDSFGRTPKDIEDADAAGILGSIFKRKWKYDNQPRHLQISLTYYLRGYELWNEACSDKAGKSPNNLGDDGYCALNAAFILDLLANQYTLPKDFDRDKNPLKKTIDGMRQQADDLRRTVIQFCEAQKEEKEGAKTRLDRALSEAIENSDVERKYDGLYWFYVTWAEALLGMDRIKEAKEKMKIAVGLPGIAPWMKESTINQIPEVIETVLRPESRSKAYALIETLSQKADRVTSAPNTFEQNEKIGLALSGGGFRASLFHIGVLAKLAELDILRRVEVISCVSGGSIIGAYYYLKLKQLLDHTPDNQIRKSDYIKIISDIERDFLQKISSNFRMRVFTNPYQAMRVGLNEKYTRTLRLADIYESELYRDLLPKENNEAIFMNDLFVNPPEYLQPRSDENLPDNKGKVRFDPKKHNRNRQNKVPALILNATSLNTGHNWQFTASYMGEPPSYINQELDARDTYRRMYYDEAPEGHKKVPLSKAVAASSCVPGLFAPIEFPGLYEKGTLRLIDGGVQDNQGINTLLEQECNVLLVSDACGQMPSLDEPKNHALGVLGRMSDIIQERVREAQIQDLKARQSSGLVKSYILMHLTKGIGSQVVDWNQCDDPYMQDDGQNKILTEYGIRKKIQRSLSQVRTDLDAFHEKEAYMLMLSGYEMTRYECELGNGKERWKEEVGDAAKERPKDGWRFKTVQPLHDSKAKSDLLNEVLLASKDRMFKLSAISDRVKYSFIGVGIAIVLATCWAVHHFIHPSKNILFWAMFATLGALVWLAADWKINKKKVKTFGFILRLVAMTLLVLLVWPIALLIYMLFNKHYFTIGQVKSLAEAKED